MFKGIHSFGCLKIAPENNCLFTSISFRELHISVIDLCLAMPMLYNI